MLRISNPGPKGSPQHQICKRVNSCNFRVAKMGWCWLVKLQVNIVIRPLLIILMQSYNKKPGKPLRSQSQLNPISMYSPAARREQRAPNYKVIVYNPDLLQSISRLQKHRVNSDSKLINALHPQLQKKTLQNMYRVNKSRSLKDILEMKLKFQEQRIQQIKRKSEARKKELEKTKKKQAIKRQQEEDKRIRQIQEQRQLDSSWRARTAQRQKSESSFILNIHRESLTMLKRSSMVYSRSERSLADDRFRQTVRHSKFIEEKRRLEKERQKYQYQYRLAFLKNQPLPKQQLPDHKLYSSLKEKSKRLTEIYSQTQHLPTLPQRKQGERSRMKETKIEKELLISPMIPREAENKSRRSKMLNPENPLSPTLKEEAVDKKIQVKLPVIHLQEKEPQPELPVSSTVHPSAQTELQQYLNTAVK